MSLDAMDRQILDILQQDGRVTNVELAGRVGLTPGPTLARVNKLEAAGYLTGYVGLVDREKLGLSVTVIVAVSLRSHTSETNAAFLKAVAELPEIIEVHHVAGDDDFLLKVVAASPRDYEQFVLEKLTAVADLQRVKSTFVLSSPKSTTAIPIPEVES
ncbi:MAG: Lrp/AsnC family transcriptional regulator [Methanoregulaceae archaeon]|nr:Lrp/AsnC family transcriptional regulator [Methanoregulaceae archaeon]